MYIIRYVRNKNAKMALNRSPELKSLDPELSAAELFEILMTPFEQTLKSSTMQSSLANVKHLRTRMVVHGQLVKHAVCLSDLYDIFLLDIVRDTRHDI